jgi:hypothetical protein
MKITLELIQDIDYVHSNYRKLWDSILFQSEEDLIKTFDSILFLFINNTDITFILELLEIEYIHSYFIKDI